MDLATSLLLFTLPIFAILVPLIQGLGKRIHARMLVGWWAVIGLLISLFGVMALIAARCAGAQVNSWSALNRRVLSVFFRHFP